MTSKNMSKTLCDTDFLIALQFGNESTHQQAFNIFQKFDNFVVSNITFWEVATVLSRKLNQSEAVKLLELIQGQFTDIYIFSADDEITTFKLYKSYTKKNISYFDCACLIVAQKLDAKIASFDKFYPTEILAKV